MKSKRWTEYVTSGWTKPMLALWSASSGVLGLWAPRVSAAPFTVLIDSGTNYTLHEESSDWRWSCSDGDLQAIWYEEPFEIFMNRYPEFCGPDTWIEEPREDEFEREIHKRYARRTIASQARERLFETHLAQPNQPWDIDRGFSLKVRNISYLYSAQSQNGAFCNGAHTRPDRTRTDPPRERRWAVVYAADILFCLPSRIEPTPQDSSAKE